MNLAGVGSVLSGIGSIAGSGIFGGGGDGIDVSENVRLNKRLGDVAAENIPKTVGGYKTAGLQHGFHPLWLMGKTPQQSQAVIAGQSNQGSQWGDALSGVGDAMVNYADRKERNRQVGLAARQSEALTQKYLAEADRARKESSLAMLQYADSVTAREAQRKNVGQDLHKAGQYLKRHQDDKSPIDVSDMVPVEEFQRHFGEAGEWEQSWRNYRKRMYDYKLDLYKPETWKNEFREMFKKWFF